MTLNYFVKAKIVSVYIHTVNFGMEIIIFERFNLKPRPNAQLEPLELRNMLDFAKLLHNYD